MTSLELLTFARGPALQVAVAVFAFGILLRLFEVVGLGRKADLSRPRSASPGSGWRTILSRSLPPAGMVKRDPVTYIAGYVFHVGLLVAIVAFAPHIALIRDVTGLGWPALPTALVDALTVAAMIALAVLLGHRLSHPVKKLLSTAGDYFAWGLTMLPLLSGYLAYHHLLLDYTLMLALHILAVEALLVFLPFTKLFHLVSVFLSRWYNGDIFGRKGVAS